MYSVSECLKSNWSIETLIHDQIFTDVTIILIDETSQLQIKAHKCILYARCQFFHNLFSFGELKDEYQIYVHNVYVASDVIKSFYDNKIWNEHHIPEPKYLLELLRCVDYFMLPISTNAFKLIFQSMNFSSEDLQSMISAAYELPRHEMTIDIIIRINHHLDIHTDLTTIPRELLRCILEYRCLLFSCFNIAVCNTHQIEIHDFKTNNNWYNIDSSNAINATKISFFNNRNALVALFCNKVQIFEPGIHTIQHKLKGSRRKYGFDICISPDDTNIILSVPTKGDNNKSTIYLLRETSLILLSYRHRIINIRYLSNGFIALYRKLQSNIISLVKIEDLMKMSCGSIDDLFAANHHKAIDINLPGPLVAISKKNLFGILSVRNGNNAKYKAFLLPDHNIQSDHTPILYSIDSYFLDNRRDQIHHYGKWLFSPDNKKIALRIITNTIYAQSQVHIFTLVGTKFITSHIHIPKMDHIHYISFSGNSNNIVMMINNCGIREIIVFDVNDKTSHSLKIKNPEIKWIISRTNLLPHDPIIDKIEEILSENNNANP